MNNIYEINPSIDIDLAKIHGFIKNNILENEYCILQKKYYILLEEFLCQEIELKQLETKMKKSNFFINNKNRLIKYLGISSIQLGIFFIRNNLNIEALTSEELNILRNSLDGHQLYLLIKNTFLKVIKVNMFYGKKIGISKILYDGTSENFLKYNESLIIGFVDDITSIKIPDEQWDTYFNKREENKNIIFTYITNCLLKKFNCKVEFIEYSLSLLEK